VGILRERHTRSPYRAPAHPMTPAFLLLWRRRLFVRLPVRQVLFLTVPTILPAWWTAGRFGFVEPYRLPAATYRLHVSRHLHLRFPILDVCTATVRLHYLHANVPALLTTADLTGCCGFTTPIHLPTYTFHQLYLPPTHYNSGYGGCLHRRWTRSLVHRTVLQ